MFFTSPSLTNQSTKYTTKSFSLSVEESCLFIELDTNTQTHTAQMHTQPHNHGHTHSGVFVMPSWDRQTPPVHHSLVHFIDLSSSLDKSTSPVWLICTRLAVLADSGCHVDSISDVTQWSLKRAMIGMETSHTKGRQRHRWKESSREEGNETSLYSLLIITCSKLKDDWRRSDASIIVYVLYVCFTCLPPSSGTEGSRADTGDSPPQPGLETLTLFRPLSTPQPLRHQVYPSRKWCCLAGDAGTGVVLGVGVQVDRLS